MWTLNATWGVSTGIESGKERLPWILAVVGIMGVIALVTVVLNLILLVSVMVHQTSRSRSFHLHIVNMAVMAIVQGGVVLPLWTHYLLTSSWLHGDTTCRWWLAADTLAMSLSAMTLVVTAWDRFIYLTCRRFIKEGGKYMCSFALITLAWLVALAVTLTLTLIDLDTDGGSYNGVQENGTCEWGSGKGNRLLVVRLIMYGVGVGLGLGLSLALLTLPCLGIGGELPMDEDDDKVARKMSLMHDHNLYLLHKYHNDDLPEIHSHGHPSDDPNAGSIARSRKTSDTERSREDSENDPDFPHFVVIKKTDRLEEREQWRWQVASLLAVAFAWVVCWLPSHLFVFAERVLGLSWGIPHWAQGSSVVLGYAHAAITPLLWLMYKPIREDMASCFSCQCCKNQDDDDDDYYDSDVELNETGPYRPTPEKTALT